MTTMNIWEKLRWWIVGFICPEYAAAESELQELHHKIAQLEAKLLEYAKMSDTHEENISLLLIENERLRGLLTGAHVVVNGGSQLNEQWLAEVREALGGE